MGRDYAKEVKELIKDARSDGRRVKMDWECPVWRGMNPSAAKELRRKGELKAKTGKHTIHLNKHSETNDKLRSQTLRHEIIEDRLMRNCGYSYEQAHRLAGRHQSDINATRF